MEKNEILEYWGRHSKGFASAAYCIRTDKHNWTEKDFFDSGLVDYKKYFESIEKELPDMDSVLEIGCGIGRLLFPIYI